MKYTIAAYFDTELEKFYPPFLVPGSTEDLTEQAIDSAKKGKIEEVGTKKLYFFGTFDSDGIFDIVKDKLLLVDLTIYGKRE